MRTKTLINEDQLTYQINKLKEKNAYNSLSKLCQDLSDTVWAKGFSPRPLSAALIQKRIMELNISYNSTRPTNLTVVQIPNEFKENKLEEYAKNNDLKNYIITYLNKQKSTLPQMIRQYLSDGATPTKEVVNIGLEIMKDLINQKIVDVIDYSFTPTYEIHQ